MKTQDDILTEILHLAKASPINDLDGEIYKKIRKTDSNKEDCVLSLISGNNGRFLQDGALSVKIFYAEQNFENTYYEDSKRGGELERMLFNFSEELLKLTGYSFQVQSRETYTQRVEEVEIHEYYAILKINFKILI